MLLVRRYIAGDLEDIIRLFYETVHTVNYQDYSEEQINAWAPEKIDKAEWHASFCRHCTYVAVDNQMIVGFGDIDDTGYLDRLYVHKDFQHKGVATVICDQLESMATNVTVHASITAKPFFEHRGYRTLQSQEVERRGVKMTNYLMQKAI